MEWMRRADLAVMNMRKTREMIVIHCQYHLPRNIYQEKIDRINAQYEIIKTFVGINFIFDNQVLDKIHQLMQFDKSINDVCDQSAPSDDAWYKYAVEIDNLMGNSITNDKLKLIALK